MDTFREIYERHYPDVLRFALFLTGDRAEAEDLAADTFVRAWIARDRIRQETLRAYLLTITRNLHRDARRRRRPQVDIDETFPDKGVPVDVQFQQTSTLRAIRQRLRHVARGDRRALLLFVVREMSYREVAQALNVSIAAVKSRIFRAREALAAAQAEPNPTGDPS
jgi:RNA polymerase sigma-70 factor (ECF subfamily)